MDNNKIETLLINLKEYIKEDRYEIVNRKENLYFEKWVNENSYLSVKDILLNLQACDFDKRTKNINPNFSSEENLYIFKPSEILSEDTIILTMYIKFKFTKNIYGEIVLFISFHEDIED